MKPYGIHIEKSECENVFCAKILNQYLLGLTAVDQSLAANEWNVLKLLHFPLTYNPPAIPHYSKSLPVHRRLAVSGDPRQLCKEQ